MTDANLDGAIAPSISHARTAAKGTRTRKALTPTTLAMALWMAMAPAHANDDTEARENAKTLDSVAVTATSVVTQTAVQAKRNSAVTVDSLDSNTIQVHGEEDSIAQRLAVAPGISLMRDEDQPRYVTARGIEANLNSTTLDGISMASVGDEGGGERKINLQLIPNDLADRVDVYKTFSAEQNPDSIGAGISLVSGSAFDHPKDSLHLDASASYHDLKNDNGRNSLPKTTSPWGKGLSGRYSTTFGGNDEFGVTVSARQQAFQTSQNKLFQSSQDFYNAAGQQIGGPTSAGWNGMSAPYNVAYYADNRWIRSVGGSAKLEWRPTDSPFHASVLLYDYAMEERRTENGFEILSSRVIRNQTPESGTLGIASLNNIFQNKIWSRNNRGVLGGLEWAQDDQWLALRAGFNRDRVNVSTDSVRLTATPLGQTLDYASPGVGEIYNITRLANPGIIGSSTYNLNSASDNHTYASARVHDIRLDYTKNTGSGARGFGFAAGVEYKRLDVGSDYTNINNVPGGNYSGYLYTPSFTYPKAAYPLPFFDFDTFRAQGAWSSLGVNGPSSLYASEASDFQYLERVRDAYLSLHYATDVIEAVVGVRYDDTDFTARTPAIGGGVVHGLTTKNGGYTNPLPSLNIVGHMTDSANVRFSASQTIGRPIPSNVAQAEVTNCDSDSGDCTISRGNPNLKPEKSTNLDVSVEQYFNANNGYVSLAVFHKKIKDNIASISTQSIGADGTLTTVTTPTNLEDSKVQGVEFSLVNRNMMLGEHRFDVLFNATHLDGRMVYKGNTGSRTIHQLTGQPKNIGNLGLTWHMPWTDSSLTVTENYTGRHIFTIGANSWQDRGFRQRYVTDASWATQLDPRWAVTVSASNLFGKDQYQTVGDSYQYMRNLNNYGATYALHVTYDFN